MITMNYETFALGFPIVCFIIGITITIILESKNEIGRYPYYQIINKTDEIIFTGWILSLIILGTIWMVILNNIDSKENKVTEERLTQQFNITSINDNSVANGEIKGGIFFTRGYINEKWQYTVYQDNNNQYTLINIPADNTVLYEREETPHYIQYCTYALEKTYDYKLFKIKMEEEQLGCRYEIIVPIGSINNTYNLDAQ